MPEPDDADKEQVANSDLHGNPPSHALQLLQLAYQFRGPEGFRRSVSPPLGRLSGTGAALPFGGSVRLPETAAFSLASAACLRRSAELGRISLDSAAQLRLAGTSLVRVADQPRC